MKTVDAANKIEDLIGLKKKLEKEVKTKITIKKGS